MLLASLALLGTPVPSAADAGVYPGDMRMSLSGVCPSGKFHVEMLVNKGKGTRISQFLSSGKAISKPEIDKLDRGLGNSIVESLSPGICDSEGSDSVVFYVRLRAGAQVHNGMLASGEQTVHKVVVSRGVVTF